jgi:hypothetical protein
VLFGAGCWDGLGVLAGALLVMVESLVNDGSGS